MRRILIVGVGGEGRGGVVVGGRGGRGQERGGGRRLTEFLKVFFSFQFSVSFLSFSSPGSGSETLF